MYATVTLNKETVEMAANAATAVRYKQIFHEDLLVFFVEDVKEAHETDFIEVAQKLGFVMMCQAKKADFAKLNEESYISWLEGQDQFELSRAAWDIINIYKKNQNGLSESKKKDEQQSGE